MLLKIDNINVSYGKKDNQIVALKDVSLQVEKGEFLVLMGKSGCGKSTLLNVLGTLKNPTAGEYYFNGNDVINMSDREKAKFRNKNIGFIVQHFALMNERTVYENIALPLHYMRMGKREIKERIDELLENMEMADRKNAYPNELSGGQCQRVAIARALATRPEVILADEPTGALDEETGNKIMQLLQRINQSGTTVIMVTHDSDFAKLGDRCITMKDGRIV